MFQQFVKADCRTSSIPLIICKVWGRSWNENRSQQFIRNEFFFCLWPKPWGFCFVFVLITMILKVRWMADFGNSKKCKNLNFLRDDCLKEEDTFWGKRKRSHWFSTAKRGMIQIDFEWGRKDECSAIWCWKKPQFALH